MQRRRWGAPGAACESALERAGSPRRREWWCPPKRLPENTKLNSSENTNRPERRVTLRCTPGNGSVSPKQIGLNI